MTLLVMNRKRLEARIAELIELLDLIDGDPDLEDDDREPEETDQDGDEQDTLCAEDDNLGGGWFKMGKLEGSCGL